MVAAEFVKRDAGKRGAHFESRETFGFCGVFASLKKQRAEAAAGPIGMNKKGANFCGIDRRVKKFGFADGGVVAAKERFTFAPAAARGDNLFI